MLGIVLNCDDEKVRRWVDMVGCQVGFLPYHGLTLGRNPKSLIFWTLVVDKGRKRLAS